MLRTLKKLIKKFREKSLPSYRSGFDLPRDESSGGRVVAFSNPNEWTTMVQTNSAIATSVGSYGSDGDKSDARIVAKPVDVVKEIITETPEIMLDDLPKQINIVRRRIRILREQNINPFDELEAMNFLKARQKYKKHIKLFGWAITNMATIDALCKKYKVQFVNFGSYHKVVPNEALDELEKYLEAYRSVRNDEPVLKLIVDQGGPEHRRDPILLASSPWSRAYYILGAWDKEVAIIEELIYKGK
jgi:hypothetical protein